MCQNINKKLKYLKGPVIKSFIRYSLHNIVDFCIVDQVAGAERFLVKS